MLANDRTRHQHILVDKRPKAHKQGGPTPRQLFARNKVLLEIVIPNGLADATADRAERRRWREYLKEVEADQRELTSKMERKKKLYG